MKDYLAAENTRNHDHHKLYERLLKTACKEQNATILIAHHLTFELPGSEPNEIPSADTLLFDHDLMHEVFGNRALTVMRSLATVPARDRETLLLSFLDNHAPIAVSV